MMKHRCTLLKLALACLRRGQVVPVLPAELVPEPEPDTSSPPLPAAKDVTERLIDALKSINPVRSNHYYVSDFDPNVNDVIAWCDEVDRAKSQNRWDDKECLSRIGFCVKGESRSWLRDWTDADRTWSSFKLQLKSLCPRRVDIANILYDVMCTESDKYSTYAEYARRSLLRLRIVKGLSNELLCAIIVRGIKDPQIRAAAMNAKLTPETIVEFLSMYIMPSKPNANVIKTVPTLIQIDPIILEITVTKGNVILVRLILKRFSVSHVAVAVIPVKVIVALNVLN